MNATETDTSSLSAMDYEPVCEAVVVNYYFLSDRIEDEEPCVNTATHIIKFHTIDGCYVTTKLMCNTCIQNMLKHDHGCLRCGEKVVISLMTIK